MTEEHKKAIAAGRAKSRAEKIARGEPLRTSRKSKSSNKVFEKPMMYYTGTEEIGNDFFTELRKALRPVRRYQICKKLEREITQISLYRNISTIKTILENHVILVKKEIDPTKIVKVRKPRAPLTEAQLVVLRDRMEKARNSRKSVKGT
jgi:hypothetical protein